ncbi:hypothetical protein Dsin_006480 [Dipteronia sinensis]|uniref:Uncharacterized protein n=1 Tax=Dipteronia sinensis TaxID=43782 RepID=A0AAE0AYG7_9ROSI|nr:hypothetical protein Dsin_006480 [Dipteronia sinensis]
MSRKGGGGGSALQKDAPWRASSTKPIPRIHHSPLLRISNNPHSNYALNIIKHPNPIGDGLAMEAIVEAAGPDCIVPGLVKPIRLLGLKVSPFYSITSFLSALIVFLCFLFLFKQVFFCFAYHRFGQLRLTSNLSNLLVENLRRLESSWTMLSTS